MRNEPKKNRTPQACLHLYNPPVPPAGYPHDPTPPLKKRNEPNPHVPLASRRLPRTQKYETNPIPTTNIHSTIYNPLAQFHPGQPPKPNSQQLFLRNEPNFTPPSCLISAKRTQFPHTKCPTTTFSTKRTQFIPAHNPITQNEPNLVTAGILPTRPYPQICETKPIPAYQASRHPLFCETNPIPRPVPSPPRWPKVTPDLSGNPIHPTIFNPQYTIYNPLAQFPATNHSPFAIY